MSKENRRMESPTRYSRGIVNMQTSGSNVRSSNVHSNRFTSNLQGRFFNNTTLDAATYKRKLEERQEKKKQALNERDRNVQLLEEEVERVKNELKKRAIERERRQKRIDSRKKRFLLYKSALIIQNNYRMHIAKRVLKTRKTVRAVQLRTFAAIMIQRQYRHYYKHYKLKRLDAAKKIQYWIREAMHQRQISLCRKLWGALSMQKLFRGYIVRQNIKRKQKLEIKLAKEAKLEAENQLRIEEETRRRVINEILEDIIVKVIANKVVVVEEEEEVDDSEEEDDECDNNKGNGFQLFLTGSITHSNVSDNCSPIIKQESTTHSNDNNNNNNDSNCNRSSDNSNLPPPPPSVSSIRCCKCNSRFKTIKTTKTK